MREKRGNEFLFDGAEVFDRFSLARKSNTDAARDWPCHSPFPPSGFLPRIHLDSFEPDLRALFGIGDLGCRAGILPDPADTGKTSGRAQREL